MFKKRKRIADTLGDITKPQPRPVENKNKIEESSSDDEAANPYVDLVSLIKESGNNCSTDSDSNSDEESDLKSKIPKVSPEEIDADMEAGSDEDQSDDSSAESDCLAEESESDLEVGQREEDAATEMKIFGESDDESHETHGGHPETDYYKQHFSIDISDKTSDMEKCKPQVIKTMQWSALETLRYARRKVDIESFTPEKPMPKRITQESLQNNYHIRKILTDKWLHISTGDKKKEEKLLFTPLQRELFTLFNSHVDVCYSDANSVRKSDDIHKTYCLHVANHILRARAKVLLNTARLKQMTAEQREQAEYRDQGITRPKVLILVPFKEIARRVVDTLLGLFRRGNKFEVGYKKRFYEEFSKDDDDDSLVLGRKPEDYQTLFAGNIDEHFRIGIALLRNSVRLYAPFYSSDIIVASPLGLRTVIGADGEKHYEHDFLSSIEIIILDHADVFLMQNWEHILHIFEHMNLTPKDSHGVDFSRVRNFSLDGLNKFYRQTISIASVALPQISSLFTKSCWNYKGCYTGETTSDKGSICAIAKHLPQVYHKLMPTNLVESAEVRFRFFVDRIYKQYKDSKMSHTVIYVPQYFDFVRLRNFMRQEWKSGAGSIFAHINDYSTQSEAGKAKRRFFTGKCPMMLYTERFHFYNRAKIRGMRNLVFYELPTYPQFYSELCNMVRETDNGGSVGNSGSVVVMYSKYDTRKLVSTVGLARCRELQASTKNVHMFVTGAGN